MYNFYEASLNTFGISNTKKQHLKFQKGAFKMFLMFQYFFPSVPSSLNAFPRWCRSCPTCRGGLWTCCDNSNLSSQKNVTTRSDMKRTSKGSFINDVTQGEEGVPSSCIFFSLLPQHHAADTCSSKTHHARPS